MRKVLPYWFTPKYQPNPDAPVEFQLKPLDPETLYTIQASFNSLGNATWSGVKAAAQFGLVGWKNVILDGAPADFNKDALSKILGGIGDADWMIWLGIICGQLYANAFLSAEEKKT